MALRIDGPWQPLDAANVAALGGYLGVYIVRNTEEEIVKIGMAGARDLFGLRTKLTEELTQYQDGYSFATEVTTSYQSRYRELLMVYSADHGDLPAANRDAPPPNLGRLSPTGG